MSNHAEGGGPEDRQNKRLNLSLPIVIRGKDAQQNEFRENTRTLLVNPHGAKLLTAQRLFVGAEIIIENPAQGTTARANVVWVSSKQNASGLREVGVQLLTSKDVWGLDLPPGDLPTEEKDQEEAKEAEANPPAPAAAPAKGATAQGPPPALSSEEIATQILRELRETADAHAHQFSERLAQIVQQVSAELEEDLRKRAAAQKKQELAAIEQQTAFSSEKLNALKAELEELNAKVAASRKSVSAALESIPLPLTTEQIHEKIESEALPVLNLITESGIGAARERFQVQAQTDAAQALTVWRSNLYVERDSILEEARQQIMMAVSSALEALQRERDAALKEMKRQIQEETQANQEKVISQIKAKLEAAGEGHGASLMDRLNQTARETGERQVSLLQTQLDALLVRQLSEAQHHAQLVGENLQTSVEDGLRAAGEKNARDFQARLKEITDKAVVSSSDQIGAEVEASGHAAEERFLPAWQARLQEVISAAVTSSSDQIRAQVDSTVQAMTEKALQFWQAKLQEVADRAAASTREQVQAQMQEALTLLGPKLQEMQEHAVNEALETFRNRFYQFLGLLQPGGNG